MRLCLPASVLCRAAAGAAHEGVGGEGSQGPGGPGVHKRRRQHSGSEDSEEELEEEEYMGPVRVGGRRTWAGAGGASRGPKPLDLEP